MTMLESISNWRKSRWQLSIY